MLRGCGRETNSSGCSRFPTLVLPRSGSEGRPFGRTLSRVAPLASTRNRIASLLQCQRGIRPTLGACPTWTFLLRQTTHDHLRRFRPEKILNVFQRIRLRFFLARGIASGWTSSPRHEGDVRQAPSRTEWTIACVGLPRSDRFIDCRRVLT